MTRETTQRAVMFADISGSTRLFSVLGDQVARDVIYAFVGRCATVAARFDGALVKGIGDAALCIFKTADGGALAASTLQNEMHAHQVGGQSLRIHIGLHFGPVMTEDRDVFGDTVNVAAYLTDMAIPEQILTSDTTYGHLTPTVQTSTRPLFRARIKGTSRETAIHEVLWRSDRDDITAINPSAQRLLPADNGALLLEWADGAIRVDHLRSAVVVGRGQHCDIVVPSRFASREHATVRTEGTDFLLVDRSINGTFVEFDDGRKLHVLRREVALDGKGKFFPGESPAEGWIRFVRDRRSMYRV
jgi:adenylate cyclase